MLNQGFRRIPWRPHRHARIVAVAVGVVVVAVVVGRGHRDGDEVVTKSL